jgi:hypothetical protein
VLLDAPTVARPMLVSFQETLIVTSVGDGFSSRAMTTIGVV